MTLLLQSITTELSPLACLSESTQYMRLCPLSVSSLLKLTPHSHGNGFSAVVGGVERASTATLQHDDTRKQLTYAWNRQSQGALGRC